MYADEDQAILYDSPGLLIYDIKNKKITNTLDFDDIGIKYLQGDEAYCLYITKNADTILFEQPFQDNKYSYDIKTGMLNKNADEELFKPKNYYNS